MLRFAQHDRVGQVLGQTPGRLDAAGLRMWRVYAIGMLTALAGGGCAPGPYWTAGPQPANVALVPNPLVIPPSEPEAIWENVTDVVDDYFRIKAEEPLRQTEGLIVEGSLETVPEPGSTLLEPWNHDSASPYERLESTLQSIRRSAVVRVRPTERGYEVSVAVYKDLEDLAQPLGADAGSATFRYDSSLTRVVNPVDEMPPEAGWVRLGRDLALEQRILNQILDRLGRP